MPAKPPRPARPQAGLRTQKRICTHERTHEHTHTHRCWHHQAQARMTTHISYRRFPFYAKTGDGKRLPRCWTFVSDHDSLNRGGFKGGEAYASALGRRVGGLQELCALPFRQTRPKGIPKRTPKHTHTHTPSKRTTPNTHLCNNSTHILVHTLILQSYY